MKIIKYSLLLFLSVAVVACYTDKSKDANLEINRIDITSPQKDSIYIYLGNKINITPEISTKSSNVTYSWSLAPYKVDAVEKDKIISVLKEVSTDKDLSYIPDKLGHYYIRLVATNEHGSTIKYYSAFVNAEYEEGFLILGKRKDGVNNISFMRKLTPDEIEQGVTPSFKQDAFAYTNNGMLLDGNVIDIEKIYNSIFMLCADTKKILKINAKTFQVEHQYDLSVLSNEFKPLSINGYDSNYCDEIYVPSMNGGVAKILLKDLEVFWYSNFKTSDKMVMNIDRYNHSASKIIFYFDTENNLWFEAGFYPPTMNFTTFSFDYFKNRNVISSFVDATGNIMTVNKDGGDMKITKIGSTGYSLSTKQIALIYDRILTANTDKFTAESKIHHNDTYSCIFFSSGSSIYQWHYNQNEISATPFVTLPDGERVKYLSSFPYDNISTPGSLGDESEIHIYTNNPSRSGLTGSLYIYSSSTGQLINKYEGISDDPVMGFYKIK